MSVATPANLGGFMTSELFVNPRELASYPGLLPSMVRACLAPNPLTLAHWLQTLSVQELHSIVGASREAAENSDVLETLCLFSVFLANVEGLPVYQASALDELVTALSLYVQSELASRQKILTLNYMRISIEQFEPSLVVVSELGAKLGVTIDIRRQARPD